MDPRTASLIEKRLRFNWVAYLLLLVSFIFLVVCASSVEYFFILLLIIALCSVGGANTFKNVLSEGESYHALARTRLTKSSSFAAFVFCVVFEICTVAFMFIFFVGHSISNCSVALS